MCAQILIPLTVMPISSHFVMMCCYMLNSQLPPPYYRAWIRTFIGYFKSTLNIKHINIDFLYAVYYMGLSIISQYGGSNITSVHINWWFQTGKKDGSLKSMNIHRSRFLRKHPQVSASCSGLIIIVRETSNAAHSASTTTRIFNANCGTEHFVT